MSTGDIVGQEFLGPGATLEVVDDETEAIGRANATEYGWQRPSGPATSTTLTA